jgi:hypothetical protein
LDAIDRSAAAAAGSGVGGTGKDRSGKPGAGSADDGQSSKFAHESSVNERHRHPNIPMDGRLLRPIARESQPALTIYLPRSHHTAQGWQGSGPGVRIFADFTSGKGLKAIAEALTSKGIPSPSAYDPARNRHRCGIAWAAASAPPRSVVALIGTGTGSGRRLGGVRPAPS